MNSPSESTAKTTRPVGYLVLVLVVVGMGYCWWNDRQELSRKLAKAEREIRQLQPRNRELSAELERRRDSSFRQETEIERLQLQRLLTGKQARITGWTTTGAEFDDSALRGKVVLLDCWSIHDPSGPNSFHRLRSMNEQYHAIGLEIIGINSSRKPDEVRSFLTGNAIPWTCLVHHEGAGPALNGDDIECVPTKVLIDPQGIVVSVTDSVDSELELQIKNLLESSRAMSDLRR